MLRRCRILLFFILDITIFLCAFIAAMLLRFDFDITSLLNLAWYDVSIIILIMFLFMFIMNVYKSLWRYTSINELVRIGIALSLSGTIIFVANIFIAIRDIPQSVIIVMFILSYMGAAGSRVLYRILRLSKSCTTANKGSSKNVLIIGAGHAGRMLMNEIRQNNSLNYKICGFLDDNINKIGRYINGVKIMGMTSNIVEIVERESIDLVIFAIPSLPVAKQKEILNLCSETSVEMQTLPPISQWMQNASALNQIHEIDISDLLGREEVELDIEGLNERLSDKVVMVTGGGGSIGSELVRQLVTYGTRKVIILDIYENSTYELEQELNNLRRSSNQSISDVEVIISSVRDYRQMERVFERTKPDIIFHAAAHKHVPLMEKEPQEAIKNNIFGTYNIATLAIKHKVKKFILISTDKAVRPTNVMGATKRFAEMVIQALSTSTTETKFSCVRFGNVLGSNGSVIPLFKKQIQDGGPVTVTDPNIIRYFMTIPEAASLVIQASVYANKGEIFVLDMGEPVKIIDLAEKLIRLSGFIPNEDIKIEFTGLRPGEKMYEELLVDGTNQQKTACDKIFIEDISSIDLKLIETYIEEMKETIANSTNTDFKEMLKKYVDTYLPEGLQKVNLGSEDYQHKTA